MESQPQSPECRNNPENFHPCTVLNNNINPKIVHTKMCQCTLQEMVIPWFVHLYMEIIHKLYSVDYLTYRWTVMV